ncbi:hypothetical protein HanPI659440_Chr07g0276261 [Helianthus annuus]|nr:hypothetical protein HanPI659440_Chr07g0276261 [Helianthus annuus]
MREEVISGIRYRDNTMQLNLNIPVEDSYTQHDYLNYGYGGEAYHHDEYLYIQPNCPDHGYGGEQSFVQQDYPDLGLGSEQNFVQQDISDQGDGGEQEKLLVDEEGSYPIIFLFETDRTFSSRDALVD